VWVNFTNVPGVRRYVEIEGFPNTYLQAWSRGTPVVAFLDPENSSLEMAWDVQ